MGYSINYEYLIISIGLILMGVKSAYDGWMILRYKRVVIFFSDKLSLYLARRFQGESTASHYLEKISRPRNVLLRGIDALITGVFLLIVGIFLFLKGSII